VTPMSWSHQSYFKTAGPPGAYMSGDPLDRLEPYLATSMPPNAAQDVFTTYDLGLIFNQPYVSGMYATPGITLELHVLGPDGNSAVDVNGAPIVLANAWSRAATTTLESYQQILGVVMPTSSCQSTNITYQQDAMTSASLGNGVALQPLTRYTVVARAGAVGATREVLQYSFRTGKYADFSAMIAAVRTWGQVAALPPNGNVTPASLLADALGALGPVNTYDIDAEDLTFRATIAALSRAPRIPAMVSHGTLLSDGSAAPLLLLEFDQTVDLRRLSPTLFLDPPSMLAPAAPGAALAQSVLQRSDGITPLILRSGDGRAVLLATPDHRDLSAHRTTISFTHGAGVIDEAGFPNQPHLLRGGADVTESAAVEIVFHAGAVNGGTE
jgi:hypothetical protein